MMNNTTESPFVNHTNYSPFINSKEESPKNLDSQLDIISLNMDQIDNLLASLETYHKSGKLSPDIKNYLKTAMKNQLSELNNLIDDL